MAEPSVEGKCVFPGEVGSLSHIAATRYFLGSQGVKVESAKSKEDAFRAVSTGRAKYAVVPIENSSSGTIVAIFDLLVEHHVMIVGELGVPENYCLCGWTGTDLGKIKRVLSHPNILEASSTYIATRLPTQPDGNVCLQTATNSTCEAVRLVAQASEAERGTLVAIGTKEAATNNKLDVLAQGVGNDAHTETRYLVISRKVQLTSHESLPFPAHVPSHTLKRSAVFVLKEEAGALSKLVACWAHRSINIAKIQTRPVPSSIAERLGLPEAAKQTWTYFFYVDFEVPVGQTQEQADRLWDALKEFSLWQRDFGTYPSSVTRTDKVASWKEQVDLMGVAK